MGAMQNIPLCRFEETKKKEPYFFAFTQMMLLHKKMGQVFFSCFQVYLVRGFSVSRAWGSGGWMGGFLNGQFTRIWKPWFCLGCLLVTISENVTFCVCRMMLVARTMLKGVWVNWPLNSNIQLDSVLARTSWQNWYTLKPSQNKKGRKFF